MVQHYENTTSLSAYAVLPTTGPFPPVPHPDTVAYSPVVLLDAYYYVIQFREPSSPLVSSNCFAVMFTYCDQCGNHHYAAHKGRRTGRYVTFSRRSDAQRLADDLNARLGEISA